MSQDLPAPDDASVDPGEFDGCFAVVPKARVGARSRGKFAAALDDHQLLDAIADVANKSGAEEPGSLSTKAWDYARANQGRQDLPTAKSALQRFHGRSWSEVLRIAVSPLDDRGRHLGWHARGEQYAGAVDVPVAKALRAVAFRLGHVPTQASYDAEVKKIEAESLRGRHMLHLHLPVSATIIANQASWDQAIARAGITQAARSRTAPPPLVEALDAIVAVTGKLPSRRYLLASVRVDDIQVSRADVNTPHADLIAKLREMRTARGESTPMEITPLSGFAPLDDAPKTFRNRRNQTYSEAELIASVRQFLHEHPDAKRTAKAYGAIAGRTPGMIGLTAMRKQGWRWQHILAAARKA